MGKSKKARKKEKNTPLQDKLPESVEREDFAQEISLKDDDPMYCGGADNAMIDAMIAQSMKMDQAVSEDAVFGKKDNCKDKVCSKCGMALIGDSNYCMGCGMIVKPAYKGGYDPLVNPHHVGAGPGGGNAYVEREAALKNRQRNRKKKVTDNVENFSFLWVFLAVLLGFGMGILVLRWYFAPEDADLTLYREARVTRIADVKSLQAGTSHEAGLLTFGDAQAGQKQNKQNQTTQKAWDDKKRNQFFYGTMHVEATGDHITMMEETEEWDTTGLEETDVAYVVNHLNYLYEKYQNIIYIENEITREEHVVRIHFVYRNLNISSNVKELVRLGVFQRECMVGIEGKEYFSFLKMREALDWDGWRLADDYHPIALDAPTLETEEGDKE